jgi:E3 ubiquitin-protein ligase RNF14
MSDEELCELASPIRANYFRQQPARAMVKIRARKQLTPIPHFVLLMDDHDDLDAPLREEELLVLQSIYPDYVTSLEEDTLRLEIPIELGSRVTVRCSASKSSNSGSDSEGTITVAHLPPILLNVKLPSRYPSEQPAVISSAYVTGSWLPNTFRLTETLQSMWTPGEGILCQWTELIQSGDILEDLDVMDERGLLQCVFLLTLRERTVFLILRLTHSSPTTLLSLLAAYDAKVSSTIFAQTSFACSICLTSLKGANCIQLACLHVFCRPCLQDYWGLCIKEGDVSRVCCPDPECVKKGDEAKEEDVRRVVSEDEVRRWKWLLVKRSMEKGQ